MSTSFSFKITRPTKPSQPVRPRFDAHNDSNSDDDSSLRREEVTALDSRGFTGTNGRSAKKDDNAPLIIPVSSNDEWRRQRFARSYKARAPGYLPEQPKSTRALKAEEVSDVMNSNPAAGGLLPERSAEAANVEQEQAPVIVPSQQPKPPKEELTEEQRALRELIASSRPDGAPAEEEDEIDAILPAADQRDRFWEGGEDEDEEMALTADDLFRRDVASRPDECTLEAYERIPVGQFGAALLRGMGWDPKTSKGPVAPYEPKHRPALLGIGATPLAQTLGVDPKSLGGKGGRREQMKFMPLARAGSGSDREARSSQPSSRDRSVSPPRRVENGSNGGRRRDDRDDRSDRDRHHRSERSHRNRDRDYDSDRDRERRRERDDGREGDRRRR